MDNGWDHTENEDKLLLSQTWALGQIKDQDSHVAITGLNTISRVGCSDNTDRTGGGHELTSLSSEYGKHLSSVVLNNVNIHSNIVFFHFNIIFYGDFKIYIHNLSVILNNIYNLIKLSCKNMDSSVKIINCINKLICKPTPPILICFQKCLNEIKCKLIVLHPIFMNLLDSYAYINYFKKETLKMINSCEDIPIVKSKLYKLINEFKCSITEFNQIESCINCIKSKIPEISQLKQKLCKEFEKILLHMCVNINITSSKLTIQITYFNKEWLRNKIKRLSNDIDALCSDIIIIQSHNNSLKSINSNILNFFISNNIKQSNLFYSISNIDLDEACSLIKSLYCWICRICCICNSDPKCTCTCKCEPPCKGNMICLCICDCTKAGAANGCCICICKKKDDSSCKCVCICICNKPGETCGCQTGTPHNCQKCLIKVEIGTLKDQTSRILCCLRCIRLYLPIFNKKCCYCRCCENGPCGSPCCIRCRSIIKYYKSIISYVHSIESLFKDVGTKMVELTTFKNILSLISVIAKKCPKCDCKEKVDSLIKHIERALHYYTSFGSRINDIRSFVEYKLNYYRSKEIITSLEKSIRPLSKQLKLINGDLVNNNNYIGKSYKLLMINYSHYKILECYVVINRLVQCEKKIDQMLQIINWPDVCNCILLLESTTIELKQIKVQKIIENITNENNKNDDLKLDEIKKLIQNDIEDNHFCLCMVTKYILYPTIVEMSYGILGMDLDTLSTISRKFTGYPQRTTIRSDVIKLLIIIVNLVDKICIFMERRYLWATSKVKVITNLLCFCRAPEDIYYPYLISITLFVSSLVENIWTMDSESIRMAIDKVSSLLSEYQSLHVYTNYGSRKSTSNVSVSTALPNLKLFSMNLSKYTKTISIETKAKNGTCNENGNSQIVLNTQINKSEALLLNNGVKLFFKSVLSSFSLLIKTPLFTLGYSNISGLAFYLIENGKIIGFSSLFLRRGLMSISIKYLNEICKKEQECTCKVKNGCKICLVGRVVSLGLSISMKKIQLILSNLSGDILLNYLKGSANITEDFITNLCVGFGEVYTIMLKNTILASNSYPGDNNVKVMSVRNWGYETDLEHRVTALSNHKSIS